MNRFSCVLAVAVAAGVLAAVPDAATGCATAWPGEPGPQNAVSVANETALVIWDEKAKAEHLVLRPQFRGPADDFGFLIPTPTRPDLGVATDDPFRGLDQLTAARVGSRLVVREVERELDFDFSCDANKPVRFAKESADAPGSAPPDGAAGGVEVLDQKTVGDYDATVLTFHKGEFDAPGDRALELAKWLAKHGYRFSPGVEKWLQKYIDDQWCVTAFRIAAPKRDGPKREVRPKPVRLSFKADRPFYPYCEPEAEPAAPSSGEPRLLRVFVAAPGRYAGKLGGAARDWPAPTVWGRAGGLESVGGSVPESETGRTRARRDPGRRPAASGRGLVADRVRGPYHLPPTTDDLYFEPAATPTPLERTPQTATTYGSSRLRRGGTTRCTAGFWARSSSEPG